VTSVTPRVTAPHVAQVFEEVPGGSLANALVDQWIGLEETDDGGWAIDFHSLLLATLDEWDFLIRG